MQGPLNFWNAEFQVIESASGGGGVVRSHFYQDRDAAELGFARVAEASPWGLVEMTQHGRILAVRSLDMSPSSRS